MRRIGARLAWARFDRAFEVRPRDDLVRLGSDYGGYVVPIDLLDPDSVCYSCGVGEDATFDLDLIAKTGCNVYAFDPTPRAARYAEAIASNEDHFRFVPYGVWSSDGPRRFDAPANPAHVSHSIGVERTGSYFMGECRRLDSLMRELGHDRIDLLKLDVEGAEYEVLPSVADGCVDVGIICAEFHAVMPVTEVVSSVRAVVDVGFTVVHVRRMTATLVRQ